MPLKFRMLAVVMILTVAMAGCAPRYNIMPLGPDTYRNSVAYNGLSQGLYGAQQVALNSSNQYCATQGLQYVVVGTNQHGNDTQGMLDIDFRCLKSGDADLKRPTMQRAPDIILQKQER